MLTIIPRFLLFLGILLTAIPSPDSPPSPSGQLTRAKKEPGVEQIIQRWNADPNAPAWELGDLGPWMENGQYSSKERLAAAPFWMGPVGVKAKLDRDARTWEIVELTAGSPADGKLAVGDVIIGANNKVFSKVKVEDYPDWAAANVLYGNAIQECWKEQQPLVLMLRGERKPREVEINIPGIGEFGDKFPGESPLADAMVHISCELLARRQLDDGSWPTGNPKDHSGSELVTSWCGLTLLASGNKEYDKQVKKAARWLAARPLPSGFTTWNAGYRAIFLGEYYLATRDKVVLECLQQLYDMLAVGQFDYFGSGHSQHTGNYRGSGITICTTHALLGMAYAKLCGCQVDENRLSRTLDHIERISPHGGVPYEIWARSDQKLTEPLPDGPNNRNEDAGRSGSAAIAFYLLGGNVEHRQRIGHFLANNSDYMDNGHTTGNTISWFWGSMGLWNTDPEAFAKHMQRRRWWIAMKRRHDGGTMGQPAECVNQRSGDQAMGPNIEVAAQTLVLCATRKTLVMSGAKAKLPEEIKRKSRLVCMPVYQQHQRRLYQMNMAREFIERIRNRDSRKKYAAWMDEAIEEWSKLAPDKDSYSNDSTKLMREQCNNFGEVVKLLPAEQQSVCLELFTGIWTHAEFSEKGDWQAEVFAGHIPYGQLKVSARLLRGDAVLAESSGVVSPNDILKSKDKVCVLSGIKNPWSEGLVLELTLRWEGLEFTVLRSPFKPDDVHEYGYNGTSPLHEIEVEVIGWDNEGMKARTNRGDEPTYGINAIGVDVDGAWKLMDKDAKKELSKRFPPGSKVILQVYGLNAYRPFVHTVKALSD